MDSKQLTSEERKQIEKFANRILEPIRGIVRIVEKPTKIHCSRTDGDGSNRIEWDQFWYDIKIETRNGSFEYSSIFNESHDPVHWVRLAWRIGWEVFRRLDGDFNSLLANNLWPKDNNLKPDYQRFLDSEAI